MELSGAALTSADFVPGSMVIHAHEFYVRFANIAQFCSLVRKVSSSQNTIPSHPTAHPILMLGISSNSVINFHSTFIRNTYAYILKTCNIDLESDYIRLLPDSKFV